MTIKWLYGYGKENLIKDVSKIKKSGVRCTDCIVREVVESATGKHITDLYEVTFVGNLLQYLKARKIMNAISR